LGRTPPAVRLSAAEFSASILYPFPSFKTDDGRLYTLASWSKRVGAAIVDGVLLAVPAFGIAALAGMRVSVTHPAPSEILARNFIWVALAVFYFPLIMVLTDGQTVGKRILRIRVVRIDGSPISGPFALLREVLVKAVLFPGLTYLPGVVVAGTVVGFADALWPLWDGQRRALHDFLVRSRVVVDPR